MMATPGRVLVVVMVLGACTASEEPAPDARTVDAAAAIDSAPSAVDASPVSDAALADAAPPDAALPDGAPPDAGLEECGIAGNLITNCGFEAGTAGWVAQFNSTTSHHTTTANTGSGSMQMEHMGLPGQSNWSARITDCIVLAADTTYTFGAAAREVGGDAVNFCHAQLRVFAGVTDCTGASTFHVAPNIPVDATWQSSEATFTASSTGDSVQVHLRCQGGAMGSQVALDDVHLAL